MTPNQSLKRKATTPSPEKRTTSKSGNGAASERLKPVRFKTSVLKKTGKPIRIVKLTRDEIARKVAALKD